MNLLTIDDLEFCKKFEREFYTTINFDYKRNTPSKDCLKLAEIYEKTTKEVATRNFSCAHCQLNLFKQLGRVYYDSLEYYKTQENAKTKEKIPTETEVKPKRTYKRKKS